MWQNKTLRKNQLGALLATIVLVLTASLVMADIGDWRKFYDAGLAELKAKNYKKAEANFKKALNIAEDELSRSEHHANTLYQLGRTLHYLGKTNKGINLMEKAHKYMRRAKGNDSDEAINILNGIAEIRLSSGRPQYAEPLYRQVLKLRIKKYGDSHNLVAATRERLAKTLALLDKNEEAVEIIELAIKHTKRNGANDAYMAGMYETYAKLLVKIGEPRKAKKVAEKAAELRATAKAQSVLNAPKKEEGNFNLVTTAGEYKEPPGFLKFKNVMINKGYNFSEEYMHSLCKNKKFFTLVHHCIVYWFKSSQRTRAGVYPSSILRVIQYATNESAQEAFNNLKKSASPDTGLNYEWGYVVVHGNHMYWLNAACAFSKPKWQTMVTEFKTSFSLSDDSSMPTLNCKCGGGCK